MSQNTTILNHLRDGNKLTRLGAMVHFGIQNITARITELREQGHPIRTRIKEDPRGQQYAEYFFENHPGYGLCCYCKHVSTYVMHGPCRSCKHFWNNKSNDHWEAK